MDSLSTSDAARAVFPLWSTAVAWVLVANLLVLMMLGPNFPDYGEDSGEYRSMALGRWDTAHQPFSARFLHPMVVAFIARTTGCSIDSVFVTITVVALPLTLLGLAVVLTRMSLPVYILVPMTFSAAFVQTVRLAYMPDMFYTLLLCLFIVLLVYRQFVLAALILVVLFCARESTIVLGIVAAACALGSNDLRRPAVVEETTKTGAAAGAPRNNRYPIFLAGAFMLATLVGFFLNRRVADRVPNVHHISGMMYFAGKAPYNFVRNILGIEVWSNTLSHSLGNHPLVRFALPHRLKLGAIDTMGINRISISFPAIWLLSATCTFGTLLTVVAQSIWIESGRPIAGGTPISGNSSGRFRELPAAVFRLFANAPFAVQVASGYGLLSMIISPLLGTSTHRYVYYAWPAFWILGPWLLLKKYRRPTDQPVFGTMIALLLVHLGLQWLPTTNLPLIDAEWSPVAGLAIAVLLQLLAWKLLRSIRKPEPAR